MEFSALEMGSGQAKELKLIEQKLAYRKNNPQLAG